MINRNKNVDLDGKINLKCQNSNEKKLEQKSYNYPYSIHEFSFNRDNKEVQFSYQQNQSQQNSYSLRDNLWSLQKQDIIQILLEQIKNNSSKKSTEILRQKKQYQQQEFINNKSTAQSYEVLKQKYLQIQNNFNRLVKDFQQYISNTSQVEAHLQKTVQSLQKKVNYLQKSNQFHIDNAKQNSILRSYNKNELNKDYIQIQKRKIAKQNADYQNLIQNLQKSLQNYLKINNELTGKVDKLQRQNRQYISSYSKIQAENATIRSQNSSFKQIIDELKDYVQQRRKMKQEIELYQSKCSKCSSYNNKQQDQQNSIFKNSSIIQQDSRLNNFDKSEHLSNSDNKYVQLNNFNDKSKQLNNFDKQLNNFDNKFQQQPLKFNQDTVIENSFIDNQNQDQMSLNSFRMLQLTNRDLKITNFKLEQIIQKKSNKIRDLLQQIQTITEQKIIFKEQFITLKNKINHYETMFAQSKISLSKQTNFISSQVVLRKSKAESISTSQANSNNDIKFQENKNFNSKGLSQSTQNDLISQSRLGYELSSTYNKTESKKQLSKSEIMTNLQQFQNQKVLNKKNQMTYNQLNGTKNYLQQQNVNKTPFKKKRGPSDFSEKQFGIIQNKQNYNTSQKTMINNVNSIVNRRLKELGSNLDPL